MAALPHRRVRAEGDQEVELAHPWGNNVAHNARKYAGNGIVRVESGTMTRTRWPARARVSMDARQSRRCLRRTRTGVLFMGIYSSTLPASRPLTR